VVHRVEYFVGEPQATVAEGFVQQIVSGGNRSYQGVLDRKTAGLGSAFPYRSHDVLHLATGQDFQMRPAPLGSRFAEGAVSSLNGHAHDALLMETTKIPPGLWRGIDDCGWCYA
jgi:hypothetical protein